MCCSVLQYVAVCCSVFQCVAVCCNVLQCIPRMRVAAPPKMHQHPKGEKQTFSENVLFLFLFCFFVFALQSKPASYDNDDMGWLQ